MTFPKQPGVYCFKNIVNNKVYIGSTQCLYTRIKQHLKSSSNQHLQNAINCYNIESFCITYQVLETKEQALCLEQMLLDYIFKLNIDCYNISLSATDGKVLADYSNHGLSCEKGGGCKAKVTYALEVNNPKNIQTFKSRYNAAKSTGVYQGEVHKSCKNIKPINSKKGRWLFSDVSIDVLKAKFNNLTLEEIKGNSNQPFILINKKTKEKIGPFYSLQEPFKQGLNIAASNLCNCLKGRFKSVGGYTAQYV